MRRCGTALAALLTLVAASTPGRAEPPAAAAPTGVLVRVAGEVPKPLELSSEAFARLPRQSVRAKDHAGKESAYEGVALIDVLKAAGLKFGPDLRGPALAAYLVVEAADGYRAVFALPELDPAFTDRVVLLVDRCDGKPLDAKEGPLRIVATGEKRHSRWVRQVVALKVGRG